MQNVDLLDLTDEPMKRNNPTTDSSQDVMVKTASGGWLCARRSRTCVHVM